MKHRGAIQAKKKAEAAPQQLPVNDLENSDVFPAHNIAKVVL